MLDIILDVIEELLRAAVELIKDVIYLTLLGL